jgi:hypothetical protein
MVDVEGSMALAPEQIEGTVPIIGHELVALDEPFVTGGLLILDDFVILKMISFQSVHTHNYTMEKERVEYSCRDVTKLCLLPTGNVLRSWVYKTPITPRRPETPFC